MTDTSIRLGRLLLSAGMFLKFQNVSLIRKTLAYPIHFMLFNEKKFSVNALILKDKV